MFCCFDVEMRVCVCVCVCVRVRVRVCARGGLYGHAHAHACAVALLGELANWLQRSAEPNVGACSHAIWSWRSFEARRAAAVCDHHEVIGARCAPAADPGDGECGRSRAAA